MNEPLTAPGRSMLPALDSVRFIGAVAVVLTHCGFWAGTYFTTPVLGPVLARLDVGVAIFFVLSGFLLSRPWLAARDTGCRAPSTWRYYAKRLIRIFPPYVVVVVLVLLTVDQDSPLQPLDWLLHLTMSGIYSGSALPHGMTQTWSLATEVAFYAVLPLLMWTALGRRRPFSPTRVLLVVVLCWIVALAWLGTDKSVERIYVNEWLPGFMGWFATGIALALAEVTARHDSRVHRLLREVASAPGACWVLVAGLLLFASSPVAGPVDFSPVTPAQFVVKNLTYAAVAVLVLLPAVFGDGSGYHRALVHPWARHLGHTSYSLFLIHLPVLHLVMAITGYQQFGGHLIEITVLTLVLSVVAAELLYRLVERPALRLNHLLRPSEAATHKAASPTTTR